MDNAVQALKIGAAILVFSIALATTFMVFAQAKQVSETVFITADNDNYMEYIEGDSDSINRIVGVETIIPTLYNYYTELYSVTIIDSEGNIIKTIDMDNYDDGAVETESMYERLDEFVEETLLGTELNEKKFEETFYEYVAKGSIYTDDTTGETIEGINTKTKIDITYREI